MAGCIPFNGEQVQRIHDSFNGCNALRDKIIFLTGCWTGLRISDILNLRYNQFVNNGVWVDTLMVFEKKNKKIREIPLGSEFKLTIRKYITEKLFSSFEDIDDCIFTKRNGNEIPPKSMIEPIKRAARIAGIPMIPRQIGTHCMRKTFANMLLNDLLSDGLPITEIFQILCDSLNQGDVRVTMKYVGWDKENAKKYTEKQTNRKLTVPQ